MGERHLRTLIFALGLLGIGGCSALTMAPVSKENQDLAYTQAAQTVVSQLTPLPLTQTARYTALPTIVLSTTQPPTATLAPTPTNTLEPIGAMPIIQMTVFSYCREGPGDQYVVDALVYPGDAFTPQGKTADGGWWYVAAPKQHRKRPADHCWIFSGATTADGDTTKVPVVPTPIIVTQPPGG